MDNVANKIDDTLRYASGPEGSKASASTLYQLGMGHTAEIQPQVFLNASGGPPTDYRTAPAQNSYNQQATVIPVQPRPASACTPRVCAIVAGILFAVAVIAAAIILGVIFGLRAASTSATSGQLSTTPSSGRLSATKLSGQSSTSLSSKQSSTTPSSGQLSTTPSSSLFNISKPCDPYSRFQCVGDPSPIGCIPISWVCDGLYDCQDKSDEATCPCDTATQYTCIEGGCIQKSQVCDGYKDCPYITGTTVSDDEWFCSTICTSSTPFKCTKSGRCIPTLLTCVGYNFCGDFSEDMYCTCTPSQTRCANRLCVSLNYWCDGLKDCRDGSDELPGCENSCPNNGVRCQVSGVCMNQVQLCDHISDCLDGSDELNCPCTSSEYRCSDNRCISKLWLCDGTRDCASGEDETLASCNTCLSSQIRCKYTSTTTCISSTQQCDGVNQCTDTSDEGGCLANNGSSASAQNLLVVNYQGVPNQLVCSDNWNQTWSDMACKQLGMGSTAWTLTNSTPPSGATLLTLNPLRGGSGSSNLLFYLLSSGTCRSNMVVAIACIPAACGTRAVDANTTGPYIVNGQLAARGAWPWQVSIFYDHNIICGGSLISDRWVLTAGHCGVDYTNASLLSVRAGSLFFFGTADPDAQIYTVDLVIVNPSYMDVASNTRNVILNDVTLLRLSKPVVFTDTIRPICLPAPNVNLAQYKVCVATGFGHTRSDAADVSNVLLQGKMQLMTTAACRSAYYGITNRLIWAATDSDFNDFVCAGNIPAANGVDICQGDSGGPLSCKDEQDVWTLIGVSSFGVNQCQLSVFARTSAYVSWIQSTMASNS